MSWTLILESPSVSVGDSLHFMDVARLPEGLADQSMAPEIPAF
jgi:hypothetical protein